MATMDRPSRIVRCPKCLALLQEPPPGTPLYKCGNCSTVLRAKHASADGSRRPSARPQQQNRATPPAHADSIDGRRLPSKSMPPDPALRQANLGDPDDQRSRTGNSRPTPAETGKKPPSHVHHSNFPPGPTPPPYVPNSSNTNDDNGLRTGRDHQRLSPRGSLAAHGSGDEDFLRGREGPTFMPQTKVSIPAHVEEPHASNRLPNRVLHNIPSPPANRISSPAAKYDTMDEMEGLADFRTRNTPLNVSTNIRQKSPPVDPAAEAARFRRPPTDMPSEAATNRERERQWKPEDRDGPTPFSPTKALAALTPQNEGPVDKMKGRQTPGLGAIQTSQGTLIRSRNRSQGDESMVTENADFVFERNLDGLRHDTSEAGPSTGRSRAEKLGVHRRQRSDGVAISDWTIGNDRNPALPAVTRPSFEDDVKEISKFPEEPIPRHHVLENEKRILPIVDKLKSRDDSLSARVEEVTVVHDQKSIARASASDAARRLNETNNASPPKANMPEEDLSAASDSTLAWPRQQKEPELKARHQEKPVVNRGSFDDEDEPRASLDNEEDSPPPTTRKPLSPPRNLLSPPSFLSSKAVFGGVQPQPEQSSNAQADSRQDSDAPSNLQVFLGHPDVLDYDTSDDSSNVDDADPSYQIVSKPHSEELKSPTFSRNGQGVQADAMDGNGNNERSDDEDEQGPTDRKSPNARSKDLLEVIGSFGPIGSGASPHFSPHRSPESIHGVSTSQAQASDQRMQEVQGAFNRQSDAFESNSFSFGQGGEVRGSAYSLLKGQTQKVRLQINTPVPERIHVRCRHCNLQLEVPLNLPRSETGVQKLRCGSCWKISRFRLNHLLSPSRSPSPGGSENSPESSFRLGSNSSDGTSGRYSGTRSNRETGSQDRVVLRTQSGANLPVPPARHNPRAASGSKLANMVSGSSLPSETSKASTPNTSGDLGVVGSSSQGRKENIDMSPSGQAEQPHVLHSPTLSSTSQDVGSKDRQQKTSPDRKLLQSSSDSEEEKASAQLKIGPTGFNPARMTAWSAPDTPEFDDGHEFKGLKGFLKKSVKELTKGKKSTQYRRKVVVNGHAVPDDIVKRAEEYAGTIHPGTYWYDFRAGFWGVMGGPCLGMIPPFIDELNFSLSRHCSHGKTGVLVNGRELHHKDLELLKKRGLPGTPGKAYNVDIDGRLTEETTGIELKGLGRLAPTLEQIGRGPGMWVPESQRGL